MLRPAFALLLVAAGASPVLANGFAINDHGAKATGRADAVAATVTDGSAMVYNPAGIAVHEGLHLYLGTNFTFPDTSFTEDRTGIQTTSQKKFAVVPNFAAFYKQGLIAFGIGVHTQYGSDIKWPAESPAADEARRTTLATFYITPTIGFDFSQWVPGLTFAGGVDVVPATVELRRDVFLGTERGTVALGGDAFGIGGRAGLMYRPEFLPELSLGVTYRSKVRFDFDGTGDFDAPPPFRTALPPDGDISATASMPQSVSAGIAYRPMPNLEVEVNLQWIGWSVFDELAIDLPDGMRTSIPRNYEDTFTYRAGLEYQLPPNMVPLDVRAGYAYDPTPVPGEYLTAVAPDVDRHVVSAGGSYHFGQRNADDIFVDVGLLYVIPGKKRTSDTPNLPQVKAEFELSALVAAVSFGWRFGAPAAPPVPAAVASN